MRKKKKNKLNIFVYYLHVWEREVRAIVSFRWSGIALHSRIANVASDTCAARAMSDSITSGVQTAGLGLTRVHASSVDTA